MNSTFTTVIISAEQSGLLQETNDLRTAALRAQLDTIGVVWVSSLGSYKGSIEKSNVVVINSAEKLNKLMDLARDYGQESILVRYADGQVELQYTNGTVEKLQGDLVQIPSITSSLYDGWTLVNERYYTVK